MRHGAQKPNCTRAFTLIEVLLAVAVFGGRVGWLVLQVGLFVCLPLRLVRVLAGGVQE